MKHFPRCLCVNSGLPFWVALAVAGPLVAISLGAPTKWLAPATGAELMVDQLAATRQVCVCPADAAAAPFEAGQTRSAAAMSESARR